MSDVMTIKSIEQLLQFLRDNGVTDNVAEIVFRQGRSKFKTFQKVLIGDLAESEQKELTEKAIKALSRLTDLSQRNIDLLGNVAELEGFGLLLNGLNLCATCAGFAILYKKLGDMSEQLSRKIDQVHATVKSGRDLQNNFEYNKALSEHTNMLDAQKTGRPYSEGKMRELVDMEYNVLILLVETLRKDVSEDKEELIFSIFSLLSMLTVSLCSFDEVYYLNNHEALSNADAWHLSHDKWMGVYETLSSTWFVEKVQDYASFETDLSTLEVDVYYLSLLDQVADMREKVEDNQRLIIAMGDMDLYQLYKDLSAKEVADAIEAAFREANLGLDETSLAAAYQGAMRQAAML